MHVISVDHLIENTRKKYLDTRTQSNLAKLNSKRDEDPDIATEQFARIVRQGMSPGG